MSIEDDIMAEAVHRGLQMAMTVKHIKDSNRIEGITIEPTSGDIAEWNRFMELEEVAVNDLCQFVYVHAGAEHRLRNRTSDCHRVGSHILNGGPQIEMHLQELLEDINMDRIDVYHAHIEYELLHPFTDGNGRSGRVLWHWHMRLKYGLDYNALTSIGFLHRFYYQSIKFAQPLSK